MSISAIQGTAYCAYTAPSRQQDSTADGARTSPAMGSDTVSISEGARKMLQNQAANAGEADKLPSENTQSAPDSEAALTTLGKNSLLSMLLENLFFAELEANTTSEGNADHGANEQASENGAQNQHQRAPQSVRPLTDSSKVAEIKKLLNDVATGKTDLSELPKVMAGSGGTSPKTGAAPKSEAHMTARPTTEGSIAEA